MESNYLLQRRQQKLGLTTPKAKEVKPIAKRSKKMIEEMAKYKPVMIQFLKDNPLCMAGLQGCNITSSAVHHQAGRLGDKLHDKKDWLAVCDPCHRTIHEQETLAKETGLSKSRHKVA